MPLPTKPTPEQKVCIEEKLGLPDDGIVLSESKAVRCADLRVYANKCHGVEDRNRQRSGIYLGACEEKLKQAEVLIKAYEDERGTWWYAHQNSVFFTGGLLLGAAATVLLTFAVNQASE